MSVQVINYPQEGHAECYQIEDKSFWFASRNYVIGKAVLKYLLPNNSFADIGGGNGFVAFFLQQNTKLDISLVEPGENGCRNAINRGVKKVFHTTIELLPNIKYDAIGFFDVLEHISDRAEFLNQIKNRLKPGGLIFVTVPAFHFLWSADDIYAQHRLRYDKKKIETELRHASFKILEAKYFFSFLFLPMLFLKALPYRLLNKKYKVNDSQHAPGKIIFTTLLWLTKFEFWLSNFISIPFGTSLLIVAKKSDSN